MKSYRLFFGLAALLLAVSLACSGLTAPTANPTIPPVPTIPPIPTIPPPVQQQPQQQQPPQPPPPTEQPQQPQNPQGQQFFTEEFDQDPGASWAIDILGPGAEDHKDSIKTEFSNSKMRIELPENDLYFYYTFLDLSYENVRIDLRADNRGVNTNNVSLTCRGGSDGWYEWSVGSGGVWYLYAVTDGFNLLANGGTNSLKQGKEVNEYTMICKDDKISMFVNGDELKQSPVTDNQYGLREGQVGFNISSLNVTPVIVEVDWFKISEP